MTGYADVAAAGPLLVAVGVSILAGLVSFASPCVVPLVPGYLSYLAAVVGADDAQGGVAVRTARWRVAGSATLFVAGFTAVVVHAYLWPVLPMRQLRASIAAVLRATAGSLVQLFAGPRPTWAGSPPSLGETIIRAHDLLDDARYLPGPEHADPAYAGVLGCLQEIDANLEYVHFLIGLEEEHPLRQRDLLMRHVLVGNPREQVVDAVEPRPLLVVGLDDVPGRLGNVGAGEGLLLGLGVGLPAHARLQVHRRELPLL